MQRLPVESSDIVSIGYDPAERLLEVEFNGGRLYHYREVEPDIYAQFMRAESHGTFFFAHINGRYRYQKADIDSDISTGDRMLAFVGDPDDLHSLQVTCEAYDIEVESLNLPIDDIQSEDLEAIAIHRAKQANKLANQPVVVSVTAWNILALHGFPGPYATAVSQWLSTDDWHKLMADKSDRTISVKRIIAYHDGKRHKLFSQDYWGTLLETPKGQGPSLERLVQLVDTSQTVAELRTAGKSVWPDGQAGAWQELAKWLRLQRRLRLF